MGINSVQRGCGVKGAPYFNPFPAYLRELPSRSVWPKDAVGYGHPRGQFVTHRDGRRYYVHPVTGAYQNAPG